MEVKLGVHLYRDKNISEIIEELKINTAQIFAQNPRSFSLSKKPLPDFFISPIFIHAPYVVNLASPEKRIFELSCKLIIEELRICDEKNWEGVVVHTGSSKGGGKEKAKSNFFKALEYIFLNYKGEKKLIVENSSGLYDGWGSSVEDLASIHKEFPVYFCLDTCHLFSAGYDLRNKNSCNKTFNIFFSAIPTERFSLIHLNDSFYPLGSRKDKHEHIGRGKIGENGFFYILEKTIDLNIPFILETPKDSQKADLENLEKVREILTRLIF